MVDDSSAPIVLLDFDGVLNAFPDAIGVRYEDVGVAPVVECRGRMTDDFGPERAFRLDGVETVRLGRRGGTWHLHWSRELAAGLDYQRLIGPVESTLVAVAVADPGQEQRATQVQRSITAAYRRGASPSDEALRAAITYITGTGDRGATVT